MRRKLELEIGQRYSSLVILGEGTLSNGKSGWKTVCDCGNTKVLSSTQLVSGNTKSCGCLHKRQLAERNKLGSGRSKYNLFINEWKDLYLYGFDTAEIGGMYTVPEVSVWRALTKAEVKLIPRGEACRIHTLDHEYFKTVDTEEKAYWLGFIAADGNIHKSKTRFYMSLQKQDKGHLEKFLLAIKSDAKIYERNVVVNLPGRDLSKRHAQCHISVNGVSFCSHLINLGIVPNKTFKLKPTKLPQELLKHYWRGFVDGDGCISFYRSGEPNISIVGTYDMCMEFKKYIKQNLGINCHIGQQKGCKIFRAQYSCQKARKIITLLYKDSKFFLNRKMGRARRVII